jgi:hypothetical protein
MTQDWTNEQAEFTPTEHTLNEELDMILEALAHITERVALLEEQASMIHEDSHELLEAVERLEAKP